MDNILIVTPVMRDVDGRARIYTRALSGIYNQRWAGQLDIHQIVGGDDYARPDWTVTRKYQEARAVFLAGKWDAMLCIETDMILPPDALTQLAALDVPVAMGLYVFRHGKKAWNAATWLEDKSWRSLSDNPQTARAVWGDPVEVVGVGQGCTLIRRDVLETIPFRYLKGTSCDWGFSLDCQAAGVRQVCHTGVVCGHIMATPRQTLWPDVNEAKLYRQEFPT